VFRTAERVAGRWTDRLIVINREDYLAARKIRVVPSRSLVYMPGIGIDTDFYSPTAVPADRQADAIRGLGIEPGTPFFAVVGELNVNKRPEDVLFALSRLRHREARVIFLGDGPRRQAMEALAAELGVADRVTLPGTVSDVRPVVAASAALLLVSRREGLPRSIMEALSMEVPVIASDARGSKDLVGAGAGTVVPIGQPITLAAAMDQVLDDPGSAREAAKRGRVRMVDQYDVAKLLDQHEELYESLLAVQR
jgi:glycosyltransferase involved in cell wall biosynthesis